MVSFGSHNPLGTEFPTLQARREKCEGAGGLWEQLVTDGTQDSRCSLPLSSAAPVMEGD